MTDVTITKESMELLLEEIVDAVEKYNNDREAQFKAVKIILSDNGIVREQL